MALDNFKNFAKVTVSIGYDASAVSIVLTTGHGAKLPTVPFNAVWWNSTDYSDPSDDPNVEIVRVTARSTDTLTITRAQESTSASTKNTGGKTYTIIAGLTAKTFNTDVIETITTNGFWMLPYFQVASSSSSASAVAIGNTVYVARVYIPVKLTVNHILFQQSNNAAAGNASVGIYSYDGNTLLIDSGIFDTSVAAAVRDKTLGASVTLNPGFYIVAWTCTQTTTGFRAVPSFAVDSIGNTDVALIATAANASSGGVLPATLGALSGVSVAVWIVKITN